MVIYGQILLSVSRVQSIRCLDVLFAATSIVNNPPRIETVKVKLQRFREYTSTVLRVYDILLQLTLVDSIVD
jgi:hypothetical protein